MTQLNKQFAQRLLEMVREDETVRTDLLNRGVLFGGYHPEMERVHNANADSLEVLLNDYGWPSQALVGDEAAKAAWLVVQHAISKPQFQRRCLSLLKEESQNRRFEASLVATLEDRIAVFEGRPQTYGTQFDWDTQGEMSAVPIVDPENVDARRLSVGLPPLHDSTQEIRARATNEGHKPPQDRESRAAEFEAWLKKVGWR